VIPDAAVEAAARAVFEQQYEPEEWKLVVWQTRQRHLDDARLALDAAAPHLMAQAWDEGKDVRRCDGVPPNPYRSQA